MLQVDSGNGRGRTSPAPPASDASSTPSSHRPFSHVVLHLSFKLTTIPAHSHKAENATHDATRSGCRCGAVPWSLSPDEQSYPTQLQFFLSNSVYKLAPLLYPTFGTRQLTFVFDACRSDVMQPYVYQPLRQAPNSIRLLQILPGDEGTDIHCHILDYTIRPDG
jgi:hypothetical protein